MILKFHRGKNWSSQERYHRQEVRGDKPNIAGSFVKQPPCPSTESTGHRGRTVTLTHIAKLQAMQMTHHRGKCTLPSLIVATDKRSLQAEMDIPVSTTALFLWEAYARLKADVAQLYMFLPGVGGWIKPDFTHFHPFCHPLSPDKTR